eukprot:CAMPEP_0179346182 /NCGR_PEP_ID=MMETSP0797-20121207/72438_1 /TAXON_ID=47934 /ORGANISM="Dinophysis acuminata, Strain DAEP01" /LENGTH=32 /DNA_ID= /DNA_START= /DNA_END= /DNA_ORIENTATION=
MTAVILGTGDFRGRMSTSSASSDGVMDMSEKR